MATRMEANPRTSIKQWMASAYPVWFYLPAGVIFFVFFLFPTVASLFFSLTRWTLFDATFIGLDNYSQFFKEPFLFQGLRNSLIYGVLTSGMKVVLGMLLGVFLTSQIVARDYLRSVVFFPVLVSTVGVGITFTALMHPTQGFINEALEMMGVKGPAWLTDPRVALLSLVLVDVWKGVGLATVIYIAGINAIPSSLQQFWNITLPLARPATFTVIILSLIGGLRSFDLIWSMTRGGPGFTTDVISSVIYKQYQAGFYGLSTAGNVVLIILVAMIIVPLSAFLNKHEVEL
jgi:raffinose/stachyose/melibiose transport system permease protein